VSRIDGRVVAMHSQFFLILCEHFVTLTIIEKLYRDWYLWHIRNLCSDGIVAYRPTLAYTVSQKNCAKLFLSELRQVSRNFNNLWHTDNTNDRFMWDALISINALPC